MLFLAWNLFTLSFGIAGYVGYAVVAYYWYHGELTLLQSLAIFAAIWIVEWMAVFLFRSIERFVVLSLINKDDE